MMVLRLARSLRIPSLSPSSSPDLYRPNRHAQSGKKPASPAPSSPSRPPGSPAVGAARELVRGNSSDLRSGSPGPQSGKDRELTRTDSSDFEKGSGSSVQLNKVSAGSSSLGKATGATLDNSRKQTSAPSTPLTQPGARDIFFGRYDAHLRSCDPANAALSGSGRSIADASGSPTVPVITASGYPIRPEVRFPNSAGK